MRILILITMSLLLLSGLSRPATAQQADDSARAAALQDTLIYQPNGLLTGTTPVTNPTDFEHKLTQNPTGALFKSMVIPGWGQFGNHKYVKGVVFFAADAWFISRAIKYRKDARDYRKLYEGATEVYLRNDYYSQYKDSKDRRNKFTWFAVITSFVSMFDAYVDAHLSGYPGEKLHKNVELSVQPQDSGGVLASLSLNF